MFKIRNIYMNPSGTYAMTKGTENLYRVYKKPEARELFIAAQKAETIEKRKKLFDEMGEYEVINETPKKHRSSRLKQFLKGLFNVY